MTFSWTIVLGNNAFVCVTSSEIALPRDVQEDVVSLQIFATVDEAILLTNDNTLLSWKGDLEARTSSI